MPALEPLLIDARYLAGLAGFLRHTITLDEARATAEHLLATRDESFLDLIHRGVYRNPHSPYRRLLTHAGIELGDVQTLVRKDGVEGALTQLYDAGVYVTSEEMKGRVPIRRNGLEFTASPGDFDNPLVVGGASMVRSSSGSTGTPMVTRYSFNTLRAMCIDEWLEYYSADGHRPYGRWSPPQISPFVTAAKVGHAATRVFFFNPVSSEPNARRLAALIAYTRIVCRLLGRRVAPMEVVPHEDAVTIARWMASLKARGTPPCMMCPGNAAVRICLAAKENNIDIRGSLFDCHGEPFTPGKAATIAEAGCTWNASYAMTEAGGQLAKTCKHSVTNDDMHFFSHRFAIIQRERDLSGSTITANLISSLQKDGPRLLLNYDTGDYATITQRKCDCLLGQIGLNMHLHDIRSYEKLTSEGSTFISTRLYDLVDRVLPARFGGAMNDYQIAEEERPDGLTQVSIVVSPRVGPVDEAAVIATVIETLESSHNDPGGETMVDVWRQGRNLQVVRREPHINAGAKVLPLHIQRTKRD